jgi:3',5'-cyclic-nucleotide phosphodiesterase
VVDGKLAIDAGSLTSGLSLEDQNSLSACIVSHAHLDHIRDLATIADNRLQANADPLLVGATRPTIDALKKHFFNDIIWPDFTALPNGERPAIRFVELDLEKPVELAGFQVRAIGVNHTIDTAGFIITGQDGSLAYSGDTGPTDRLWELLNQTPDLKALLCEVSFPNIEQALATASGHHTPQTLAADLSKLIKPKDIPTLLYHIKPVFQVEVERQIAALTGFNLHVSALDERFSF